MKKYKYKKMSIEIFTTEFLEKEGNEGWELCGITETYFLLKKECSKDIHIGLLISCAYARGVANLQHRTIAEFAQFVEDVMKGKYPKYEFDWNSTDAIETWIEKFHEYYIEVEKTFQTIQ